MHLDQPAHRRLDVLHLLLRNTGCDSGGSPRGWRGSFQIGLLDSVCGLILICTLINLPIAVWMSYTYFCEIPGAILEAARVDGAGAFSELWHILTPLALQGISSTALLLIVL